MGVYLDNFNSDTTWNKIGSYVDSSYNVSGGVNTLTAGAGADTSAWTKSDFTGLDASITVRVGPAVTGVPQIHFRESSQGNYLVAYLSSSDLSIHIGQVVGGVYTEYDSVTASIVMGGTFTFMAKVFGNCFYAATLIGDGTDNVFKKLKYISSDVSAFTGQKHGYGVTSGTQKYDWVDMRILRNFINVVAVGDSNVGSDNRLFWPNLLQKRHFKEGFVSENQGVSGQDTQYFLDNAATTIDPFVVTGTGVRNILTIATGNNDYVHGYTAAETYALQLDLIAYAKALGYECELATLIPFVYADVGGITALDFVTDLNTLIRDGAVTHGYTLCEIHNAFGATDGQLGVSPSDLVNGDQIHYSTASGHPLAARTHNYTLTGNHRLPVT